MSEIIDRVDHPESHKVEGKRNLVRPGAWVKVKGVRGEFKVHRLDRFSDGTLEALCWWVSSRQTKNPIAHWRTVLLESPTCEPVPLTRISKVLER